MDFKNIFKSKEAVKKIVRKTTGQAEPKNKNVEESEAYTRTKKANLVKKAEEAAKKKFYDKQWKK